MFAKSNLGVLSVQWTVWNILANRS